VHPTPDSFVPNAAAQARAQARSNPQPEARAPERYQRRGYDRSVRRYYPMDHPLHRN
jgi:hypothetical protein